MITFDVHVERPVDEVFDYMADFRNENEWNVVASDLKMITPEPVGVGSRFTGEYQRMGTMRYEITRYDRPGRLDVKGDAKNFEWSSTFTLTQEGAGTKMVGTMDPHPTGIMRFAKPLMEPMIKGQIKKGMASFKRTLESKDA
jgi:hypothetical protein